MATLKTIYKDLLETAEHQNSGEDLEYYLKVEAYLKAYLQGEEKEFTLRWYNEFLEEDCELAHRIKDILRLQQYKAYAHALAFVRNPTEEGYLSLLREFYHLLMSGIAGYLSDTEELTDRNELCLLALYAQLYVPLDEQVLAVKTLDYKIQAESEIYASMDARYTLVPLVFHLAKDYIQVDDEEFAKVVSAGLERFTFNELYQQAYQVYLSENQAEVADIFKQLCEYHLKKSVDTFKHFPEFEYALFQAVPWEILVLLRQRVKQGHDISFIQHPLINPFMPYMGLEFPDLLTADQLKLRQIMFADYHYVPMQSLT